ERLDRVGGRFVVRGRAGEAARAGLHPGREHGVQKQAPPPAQPPDLALPLPAAAVSHSTPAPTMDLDSRFGDLTSDLQTTKRAHCASRNRNAGIFVIVRKVLLASAKGEGIEEEKSPQAARRGSGSLEDLCAGRPSEGLALA